MIENVADPNNAAACIRTSESYGFHNIHFIDRYNYRKGETTQVSRHSNKWCQLHSHLTTESCMQHLKQQHYKIIATDFPLANTQKEDFWIKEQQKPCITIQQFIEKEILANENPSKIAIVMGNENRGISETVRYYADYRVYIPQVGMTQSFNVSVACSLFLYHLSLVHETQKPFLKPLEEHQQLELLARYMVLAGGQSTNPVLRRANVKLQDY